MKVPALLKFDFDPDTATFIDLKDKYTLIIWGCIKSQHVTDQHFNHSVELFVEGIKKYAPPTYAEFRRIITYSRLSKYGVKSEKSPDGPTTFPRTTLDDEFWEGIWEYLSGEKELVVEINKK